MQQELARQQMLLEKGHDQFNEQNQLRNQWESRLQEIRDMYKTVVGDVHQQRKKSELQDLFEIFITRMNFALQIVLNGSVFLDYLGLRFVFSINHQ